VHFAARQRQGVPDGGVEVEPVLLRGGVLGQGADAGDGGRRALAVGCDPPGGLLSTLQVLGGEPAQAQALALLTMAPSG